MWEVPEHISILIGLAPPELLRRCLEIFVVATYAYGFICAFAATCMPISPQLHM